jgi:UDP-N-acetylglucosamine diphosphorylase/glucosamine-1-phosphate N-acetyltransferase
LQPLAGKPLLYHVLQALGSLLVDRLLVVVGFQSSQVRQEFANLGIEFVEQKEQLGTGHAILQAEEALKGFSGDVLVLCGDMPFIKNSTLSQLVELHRSEDAACTLLTLKSRNKNDYGRIIRGGNRKIVRIVESRDASPEEIEVDEFNSGVYLFDKGFLFKALSSLGTENSQNEYYLTDTIQICVREKLHIHALVTDDSDEIFGINSQDDLKKAERLVSGRDGD